VCLLERESPESPEYPESLKSSDLVRMVGMSANVLVLVGVLKACSEEAEWLVPWRAVLFVEAVLVAFEAPTDLLDPVAPSALEALRVLTPPAFVTLAVLVALALLAGAAARGLS
jgi:hypothetical protein